MLVSHRKKFIFTKTFKTAGTSVESYYEPLCMPSGDWSRSHPREEYISETGIIGYRGVNPEGCKFVNHMSAESIKELIGEDIWNNYYKFTVIRNPFSKLVSGWYHWHKSKTNNLERFKSALKRPNQAPLLFFRKRDIFDFRNWILSGGDIIDRDKYMINDQECVDYFIKYEALLDDIKTLNAKLSIDPKELHLPQFKAGIRSNNFEIREFYNSRTEKIVRQKYDWEFKKFGYEMP